MRATRKAMHGPLWTVDDEQGLVQLWAPSATRDHWSLGWSVYEDGETTDSGFVQRDGMVFMDVMEEQAPAVIHGHVRAVLTAAGAWHPVQDADCPHYGRAHSFGCRPGGRLECGYCGRLFDEIPEEER